MSEPFAYHVFAHRSGRYQTVAALGISESETKSLEQFFFGQTNNDDYLASLDKEPGVVWRMVGDQGALTRVRQGEPDSNGRATLRFETLLIPPNKLRSVGEQTGDIVLAEWKVLSDGVAISPDPSQKPGSIHPDKVSDVLMAVRSGKRIARRADEFSLRDVSKIIADCTDDPTFTLCFKSLNRTAPVSVNLVSLDITERIMSTPQVKSPREAAIRPRGDLPVRASPSSVSLILSVICLALVVQTLVIWRVVRVQRDESPSDAMQKAIIADVERAKGEISSDLGKKLDTLESSSNKRLESMKAEWDSRLTSITEDERKRADAAETQNKTLQKKMDDVSRLIGDPAAMKKQLDGLETRLSELGKNTGETKKAVDELSKNDDEMKKEIKAIVDQLKKSSGETEPSTGGTPPNPVKGKKGP